MAARDPVFTCELCGENKPTRTSTGKVYCGDCWRDLMYLWETAKRNAKKTEPPQKARAEAPYPIGEQTPHTEISYTIGEDIEDAIAETPP